MFIDRGFKNNILCCVQSIREKYHDYEEDKKKQIIVFDKDQVVLDLPDSPPKVVNGWKILPLTYPQVYTTCLTIIMITCMFPYCGVNGLFSQITKVDVQQFKCDRAPPACTIELEWIGRGKPKRLSYKVNIIGAKKPNNFFYMRYSLQESESLCPYTLCCAYTSTS